MDRSDVAVMVIDASTGITNQDKHIAGYAVESSCAIVIVVNKWDTVEKENMTMKKFEADVRNNFQFLSFASIVFLSALTKKRIHTLMPEIIKSYENYKKEIKTSLLNDVISEAVLQNPPPSHKGKKLKLYFCNQEDSKPPKFKIQVNNKELIHFSYERYLENKIRENIDFTGTPIVLNFKNKRE
jgi:GTP-binding protein